MEKNAVDLIKNNNLLGLVYQDLLQPGVRAVGQCLGTVLEFCSAISLPIKLQNEKVKVLFTKRLNEYKEKVNEIPDEKRCEVHPQIGIPIIEKLTYTTDEQIAEMFTNLLASASSVDYAHLAHPSFIDKISKLSPDEARIIQYLSQNDFVCYCDWFGNSREGDGFLVLRSHLTMIPFEVTLMYPDNMPIYLDNLISLGIIKDMNGSYKVQDTVYKQINEFYGLDYFINSIVPGNYQSITVNKSFFDVTEIGRLFIKSCVR